MFARGFKAWCERTAVQQRKDLGLKPSAPLNPFILAEKIGVRIMKVSEIPGLSSKHLNTLLNEDPDSWSAITLCVGPSNLIIVNESHSLARQNSDLMHEIAHLIIGHTPHRVDVPEDGMLLIRSHDKQQEEEANWLSGCLLLPRDAILEITRKRVPVETARSLFGVSESMLSYRKNVTGVRSFRPKTSSRSM